MDNGTIFLFKDEQKVNSTLKLFLEKLIHKAFPEFSNKVTWTLITVGVAILVIPTPTYLMFINLFIDLYNNATKSHVNLIDIGSFTPGNGAAITLILSGLIYHLAIKSIQIFAEIHADKIKFKTKELTIKAEKEKSEKLIAADKKLFEYFTSLLPTDSLSIEMLKDQHFGTPYHKNCIADIESFTYKWGKADHHFHNKELELKSEKFFNETKGFLNFLAISSGFIGAGPLLSIPTDNERANDWEWTAHTNERVKKANEWSHELHDKYCDFIAVSKRELSI